MEMTVFVIQNAPAVDGIDADGHERTKLPYPFFVDGDGKIGRQDFWQGDPGRVVGFQKDLAVMQIDLRWAEAVGDLWQAVGMYLVTENSHGQYGVHLTAVQSVREAPEGAV
jgi:hypothetical protein